MWGMFADTSANRRVILACEFESQPRVFCRYVQQRLQLVREWSNVPPSRHVAFPHQQQDRSRYFQFKLSLLKETEFLFSTGKSVFQTYATITFLHRFVEIAIFFNLFYFKQKIFLLSPQIHLFSHLPAMGK